MPDLLDAQLPGSAHGRFTTRGGGVSAGPWASANLALHVADRPGDVLDNRARLADALEPAADRLVFAEQVHGVGVAVVGPQVAGDGAGPEAVAGVDALVTREPRTALVMMAADCLPVLLADEVADVVAAAHAGRRGLLAGVLQETLRVMAEQGGRPGCTTAVIGPAICGRCYELPADVVDEVEQVLPGTRTVTSRGTPGVDLAAGAEHLLRTAGVARVRRLGGCTAEQPDTFYSYRRDGRTGRQAGVVWLA